MSTHRTPWLSSKGPALKCSHKETLERILIAEPFAIAKMLEAVKTATKGKLHVEHELLPSVKQQ